MNQILGAHASLQGPLGKGGRTGRSLLHVFDETTNCHKRQETSRLARLAVGRLRVGGGVPEAVAMKGCAKLAAVGLQSFVGCWTRARCAKKTINTLLTATKLTPVFYTQYCKGTSKHWSRCFHLQRRSCTFPTCTVDPHLGQQRIPVPAGSSAEKVENTGGSG